MREKKNLGEPKVRKDHVEGLEKTERDGEQTKRRWCLFSLWLVMGDCSQHKHMPSWLTHFLLLSTSQHWATQAQDTTASCACVSGVCVHLHTCMCGMCARWFLWFAWTHGVCGSLSVIIMTLSVGCRNKSHIKHPTQRKI